MCTKVGHLREKMTNVNNEATLEIFPKDEKVFFFFGGGVLLLTWTNRDPHVSHLYGFSPEWIRV